MSTNKPTVLYTRQIRAPEVGKSATLGGVHNHPKLGSLPMVYTSTVWEVLDNGVIITSNTRYVPTSENFSPRSS